MADFMFQNMAYRATVFRTGDRGKKIYDAIANRLYLSDLSLSVNFWPK